MCKKHKAVSEWLRCDSHHSGDLRGEKEAYSCLLYVLVFKIRVWTESRLNILCDSKSLGKSRTVGVVGR